MEVDRVTKGLGPEPRRSSCLSSEGCCKHIDGTNGALGDGVEVMVVRRARGRITTPSMRRDSSTRQTSEATEAMCMILFLMDEKDPGLRVFVKKSA
eukprot:scaffold14694_cov87-Phaeocystis_antarctica.AAC.2